VSSEQSNHLAEREDALETVRPSLRARQRAERECLILKEAERMLAEQGYDGLILDLLAERVGISKGTIYQHFAKKEDLFGEIILRGLERVDAQLTAHLAERDQPATTRLAAILTSLINSHPAWMSAVAVPQKHDLASALAHHAGLRDAFERFLEKLSALIEQGQERGELDPTIPAAIAARFLLSLVRTRGGPALPANVSGEEFAMLAVRFYVRGMSAHRPEA
jgi:AcrR family transcriptional regulator